MGQVQKPSFKILMNIKTSNISSHRDKEDLGRRREDWVTRQGEQGLREEIKAAAAALCLLTAD